MEKKCSLPLCHGLCTWALCTAFLQAACLNSWFHKRETCLPPMCSFLGEVPQNSSLLHQIPRSQNITILPCATMRQQEWMALPKSADHRTKSWLYIWFLSQLRMMKIDTSAYRQQRELIPFLCQLVKLCLDERNWEHFPSQPNPCSAPDCIVGLHRTQHRPDLPTFQLSEKRGFVEQTGFLTTSPKQGKRGWWSLAGRCRNILRCFLHRCTIVAQDAAWCECSCQSLGW